MALMGAGYRRTEAFSRNQRGEGVVVSYFGERRQDERVVVRSLFSEFEAWNWGVGLGLDQSEGSPEKVLCCCCGCCCCGGGRRQDRHTLSRILEGVQVQVAPPSCSFS